MSYAAEVEADSPVGWWRMNEASGVILDETVNNNDATTVRGTPVYAETGAIESDGAANDAITLNGTDEAYEMPSGTSSLDVGDTFTLEAWIKRAANGATHNIIEKGGNGTTQGAYKLLINNSNQIQLTRSTIADIVVSTSTITDTDWHHVVATKSGATVKLYLDTVDVTGSVSDSTFNNHDGTWAIGSSFIYDSGWFNGTLDEIAVYGTALSAARVQAHYEAASAPPGAAFVIPHRTM